MFEKIKGYYDSKLWNKQRVWNVVNKAITPEQYELITGDIYVA